jgi:hypothetical protein
VTGTGEDVTKTTSFTLTVSSSSATFNFSLSNDGNKSVTQGQSIVSNITATLSSGSSQAVSFSTAGLPTGATASYSTSTSCTPTCSRILNIATINSTPVGTYTITVTGAGGEVNKSTSFSLTVTSTTSTAITSPSQGTTFRPGQTVTATGSGINLVWDIDLIGDGLPSFKTGTGSSITFTVPASATSSQLVRIILTGSGQTEITISLRAIRHLRLRSISLSATGNKSVTAGSSVILQLTTLVSGSTQHRILSRDYRQNNSFVFSGQLQPSALFTCAINIGASTPAVALISHGNGRDAKTTAFGLTVGAPTSLAQLTLTCKTTRQ